VRYKEEEKRTKKRFCFGTPIILGMHTGQTLSSSGSERRYSIAFNAGKMEMAATHGQIDDNEHDNDIII
jgi:hypothetical protein